MVKLSEMKEKEVININNGEKIGFIYDFEIDIESGDITDIVLPSMGKILGLFGKSNDLVIPWENMMKIGTDTILVDLEINE